VPTFTKLYPETGILFEQNTFNLKNILKQLAEALRYEQEGRGFDS